MGGDDSFANKVVGRLTNTRILGHYKQEKEGKDVFGKLIPKYIQMILLESKNTTICKVNIN